MPGQDQSRSASGMFQQINAGISEMGNAGNQYVDTLRRSFAPTIDPNSSASLNNYANYARRNNYTQEAQEYRRLAMAQGQVEREETRREATSQAQLAVARRLSDAQRIATDTTIPAAQRQEKIRALSEEAQGIAATAQLDPRTVLTPINQLLNYVSDKETAGQAATIQAEASQLQTEIATALANDNVDLANELVGEYSAVVDRANAHGDATLVNNVNSGLNTLIGKLPDAAKRRRATLAARAIELNETGGSAADIEALLSDPLVREEYNKQLAQKEADELAIANAQADLANALALKEKRDGEAADRAAEGVLLNKKSDLAFLTPEQFAQYKQQHTDASESLSRRIGINETWRATNKYNQDQREKGLANEATAYVLRMPMVLGDMEESTDFSYDLDDWAEMTLVKPERWQAHAEVIAGLLAQDPRFIGGTVEEKEKLAKEMTIKHMNGVSENFRTAWAANEKARKTRDKAEGVRAEEAAADWKEGTSPVKNKEFVEAQYNEWSQRSLQSGIMPLTYEDWIEQVWKRWNHNPTIRANNTVSRGPQGNKVETDLATHLFPGRRAGSQAARQPAANSGQPGIVDRQRGNLSPAIGPIGTDDDYQTKLRKAREAQPNSPYPPLPDAADPYIDPRYTQFRGN